MDVEELLSGLTPEQHAGVTSEAAPLCIVAAAGSGKTRVLTRRIAYRCATGRADATHTLALTFTRKAAAELQTRLTTLGLRDRVAAGTFHSHASAQLQRWWRDRRQSPPRLLERKSRLLAPIVTDRSALSGVSLADVASAIEWAKARALAPDQLEAVLASSDRRLPAGMNPSALTGVYARYEDEKRRRGLIDFDDLLARCADAIERDPEFAGAQRWRWRHVYVDEFQDLNPLQHRLLLAWLGTSTDLCVVGDPHQAIYGWNGADPHLLDELPDRWPSAATIRLDLNHRSTDQIVRAASAVLPATATAVHAVKQGELPEVHACASDLAEAAEIAARLARAARHGRRWSSMAVLARTNAQLSLIEHALDKAGIPYWSAAKAGLLDDPAVRDLIAAVGSHTGAPIQVAVRDLQSELAGGDGTDEALQALLESSQTLAAVRPDATVGEWIDWLPTSAKDRSDAPRTGDSVTLSSFHRAKGLEWDLVWVAGVEEGLVPMARAARGEPEAEERRLLYVAMTRAVEELHVSWSATRSFGGRPVPRAASRWLELVERSIGAVVPREGPPRDGPAGGSRSGATDAVAWRRRIAVQRDVLRQRVAATGRPLERRSPDAAGAPDASLLGALRSWRLETARLSGVAPHLILHDATIDALAALRPSTTDALLTVPGLGPVKASRYGAQLIEVVAGQRARSA